MLRKSRKLLKGKSIYLEKTTPLTDDDTKTKLIPSAIDTICLHAVAPKP